MVDEAKAKGLPIPPRVDGDGSVLGRSGGGAAAGERVRRRQIARTSQRSGGTHEMSHDSDAAYRCPKCGATSALLMPEPVVAGRARDPEVPRMRAHPARAAPSGGGRGRAGSIPTDPVE